MNITGRQLAEFAAKRWRDGARYWYGTCYFRCTEALLATKTAQYPGHYTAARLSGYLRDIKDGAMCCDCVGLIKGAVWSRLGTQTAQAGYAQYGAPDLSADQMIQFCQDRGAVSALPEAPGIMLHMKGHVGVYIGGGWAIEARSFADGVVKTKVAGRGWTSWGRLPFIAYEAISGGGGADTGGTGKLGGRTLRRGSKGNDVKELQTALVLLRFDCGRYGPDRDGVDGDYGFITEAAVKAMQARAGIKTDGIFGPISMRSLTAMLEAGRAPRHYNEGSGPEGGGKDAAVFTVTIKGLDGPEAAWLLERYSEAAAAEE